MNDFMETGLSQQQYTTTTMPATKTPATIADCTLALTLACGSCGVTNTVQHTLAPLGAPSNASDIIVMTPRASPLWAMTTAATLADDARFESGKQRAMAEQEYFSSLYDDHRQYDCWVDRQPPPAGLYHFAIPSAAAVHDAMPSPTGPETTSLSTSSSSFAASMHAEEEHDDGDAMPSPPLSGFLPDEARAAEEQQKQSGNSAEGLLFCVDDSLLNFDMDEFQEWLKTAATDF
ncbi:hypothetical protein BKA81DRAFT_374552 [Phyllosticta paracitricarpa]|uniref:Uncharacterized protein n=1 Tax=Phyllosticta paracitricarpa TaxID=2016321 RepID=A0ABR1MSH3_9PEZI